MCAAALLLGGCTGDADPIVTSTPSPSPSVAAVDPSTSASPSASASPSPSATALTEEEVLAAIPEDARSEGFISAVMFSRYFLELYGPMFAPPYDRGTFQSLSDDECDFCASAVDSSASAEDAGTESRGASITWLDDAPVAQGGLREDGFWYITQRYELSPRAVLDSSGSELSSDEGSRGRAGVKLGWSDGRWAVFGVEIEPDDAA
ncbi:MAG: hypothetical protein ACK5IM_00010 [Demequina sp.]|uniref:hypothetical protein n=1 Tax=Demequina sp. TaxID=2050685 RepID=UPI003A87D223